MLDITQSAEQAIRQLVTDAGTDIYGLRIAVQAGGCAGLKYSLGLDTQSDTGDTIIPCGSTHILVDANSMPWLNGSVLDFSQKDGEAGFVFDNPNAVGLCSCSGGTCGEG